MGYGSVGDAIADKKYVAKTEIANLRWVIAYCCITLKSKADFNSKVKTWAKR